MAEQNKLKALLGEEFSPGNPPKEISCPMGCGDSDDALTMKRHRLENSGDLWAAHYECDKCSSLVILGDSDLLVQKMKNDYGTRP